MKSVTIYLNEEKTRFRVIRPTDKFNGDWKALVNAVSNGLYNSYNIN